MLKKLTRYFYSVVNMKPSQVYHRIRKMAGMSSGLGYVPKKYDQIHYISTPADLDFDPAFLMRFSADALMRDEVEFLHEAESFDWNRGWEVESRSPLWNFNLHYCEYLLVLLHQGIITKDHCYIHKAMNIIHAWIDNNPIQNGGPGWAAYTVAMRLTNWIAFLSELRQPVDDSMIASMHQQYVFLSAHLEKDLLGNHYLEDLKALILCALFFDDREMLNRVLPVFVRECRRQMLPDGMHYELSPMYHCIMLECVIRTAYALQGEKICDDRLYRIIADMTDVAYSLCNGLERVPLFNDGGSNVAKSLPALLSTAKQLGIEPKQKAAFPDAGYYIFIEDDLKLIVDAGQVGPKFNPGHAHCDAMSFELFRAGKPIVVNCGTYAYQCAERTFFRSTQAHNTVSADGREQSDMWSVFRVAKRMRIKRVDAGEKGMLIELVDQRGTSVTRSIALKNRTVLVRDEAKGHNLDSYVHCSPQMVQIVHGNSKPVKHRYAPEYGAMTWIDSLCISGDDWIEYRIEG